MPNLIDVEIGVKKVGEDVAGIITKMQNFDSLIKEKDTLNQETIAKMKIDLDAFLKSQEEMTVTLKEIKFTQDFQEKIISRKADSSTSEDKTLTENQIKYQKQFKTYMQCGEKMPVQDMKNALFDVYIKAGYTKDESEHVVKTMSAGSGPDGGFLSQSELLPIKVAREFETSPIRELSSVISTGDESVTMPIDYDETVFFWVGEVSTRPLSNTAQLGIVKIPIMTAASRVRVTQKLLDMPGFDAEGFVIGKSQTSIGRGENTAYLLGDLSTRPKGMMTYPASATAAYQRGSIQQVNSGDATLITADGLRRQQTALKESYQANATWGMSRLTWGEVTLLKDQNDNYLINQTLLATGAPMVLLGKPVRFMADVAEIAGGALSALYADFRQFYTIVDQMGFRILRDPFSVKEQGIVEFMVSKNTGGAVTNYEAGKILVIAA